MKSLLLSATGLIVSLLTMPAFALVCSTTTPNYDFKSVEKVSVSQDGFSIGPIQNAPFNSLDMSGGNANSSFVSQVRFAGVVEDAIKPAKVLVSVALVSQLPGSISIEMSDTGETIVYSCK